MVSCRLADLNGIRCTPLHKTTTAPDSIPAAQGLFSLIVAGPGFEPGYGLTAMLIGGSSRSREIFGACGRAAGGVTPSAVRMDAGGVSGAQPAAMVCRQKMASGFTGAPVMPRMRGGATVRRKL
jgi:hypothetical protein